MYQITGCCVIGVMLQAGSKLRSIAAGAKCKLKANSKLRSIAAGEAEEACDRLKSTAYRKQRAEEHHCQKNRLPVKRCLTTSERHRYAEKHRKETTRQSARIAMTV